MPVLILSMKATDHQRRPAVVFLHGTSKCKEWLRPLLEVDILFSIITSLTLYMITKDRTYCNLICLGHMLHGDMFLLPLILVTVANVQEV